MTSNLLNLGNGAESDLPALGGKPQAAEEERFVGFASGS